MFSRKNVFALIAVTALLALAATPSFAVPRSCDQQCGCQASCNTLCTIVGTTVISCGQIMHCQDFCGGITNDEDTSVQDIFGFEALLLSPDQGACAAVQAEEPVEVENESNEEVVRADD